MGSERGYIGPRSRNWVLTAREPDQEQLLVPQIIPSSSGTDLQHLPLRFIRVWGLGLGFRGEDPKPFIRHPLLVSGYPLLGYWQALRASWLMAYTWTLKYLQSDYFKHDGPSIICDLGIWTLWLIVCAGIMTEHVQTGPHIVKCGLLHSVGATAMTQ